MYESTKVPSYFRAMYVYSCTRTRTRTFGIGYVYDRVHVLYSMYQGIK